MELEGGQTGWGQSVFPRVPWPGGRGHLLPVSLITPSGVTGETTSSAWQCQLWVGPL